MFNITNRQRKINSYAIFHILVITQDRKYGKACITFSGIISLNRNSYEFYALIRKRGKHKSWGL